MEPLAHKIRPKNLEEYIGQAHLVGKGMPIRVAMEQRHVFSFILWGPPGVGKTTLAKIYANAVGAELFELSAVSATKDEVRQVIEMPTFLGKTKILFLDEIHRFNKAQQDFLLPFVERGEIVLIGATTENPSFEVIPALLSRARVFVLKELNNEEVSQVLKRTGIDISEEAKDYLVNLANGDARQALSVLENAKNLYKEVNLENLKNSLQSPYLRYDKKGEEHYNVISAFIKSMRASQVDAALYYLGRMVVSGEDPLFIARRMVIFASEDIGVEDSNALVVANNVFRACETIGYPECSINLGHGVVYMSNAPKSKAGYYATLEAMDDAKKYGNLPIPMEIRNAPTKLMKDLGYGKGYEMYTKEELLPLKLKGRKYFK